MNPQAAKFRPTSLTPDFYGRAADVCARAFFADPMGVYWVADEPKRLAKIAAFYRAAFKCGQGYNEAYFVFGGTPRSGGAALSPPGAGEGRAPGRTPESNDGPAVSSAPGAPAPGAVGGVAVWSAPGTPQYALRRRLLSGLTAVPLTFGWRGYQNYRALFALMDRGHERTITGPHWYLDTLCTDPPAQGQGIGSALIQHGLDKADAARLPCYLETMTEKNVRFYEKRGFKVMWDGAPKDGPPNDGPTSKRGPTVWGMLRAPQR